MMSAPPLALLWQPLLGSLANALPDLRRDGHLTCNGPLGSRACRRLAWVGIDREIEVEVE